MLGSSCATSGSGVVAKPVRLQLAWNVEDPTPVTRGYRHAAVPDSHVIEIPNSAVIKMARGFLSRNDWTIEDGAETIIRFHPAWCHMQPWVLAALGAWAFKARNRGVTIRVENPGTAGYAWRFGLAELLGIDDPVPIQPHEEAGRFIPLKVVTGAHDVRPLISDVAPLLHLDAEPEQAKAIQYVVSEMVRNVLEHSRTQVGAVVAAQFYRGLRGDRSYVSIGIADAGIGIRSSLRHNYPDIDSDTDALLTAIRPGTTGAVGRSENAGAGLFFTRNLATSTNGYFAIGSGEAMFRTSRARQAPLDAALVFPISKYPGTIVCVEITLDQPIDFNEFLADTRESFFARAERTSRRAAELVRFR